VIVTLLIGILRPIRSTPTKTLAAGAGQLRRGVGGSRFDEARQLDGILDSSEAIPSDAST
uniref:Uncharacterized protein n=1 Tax=Triticum urartu TaxID=4572 RepID=A0A8R7PIL7_TRIUA